MSSYGDFVILGIGGAAEVAVAPPLSLELGLDRAAPCSTAPLPRPMRLSLQPDFADQVGRPKSAVRALWSDAFAQVDTVNARIASRAIRSVPRRATLTTSWSGVSPSTSCSEPGRIRRARRRARRPKSSGCRPRSVVLRQVHAFAERPPVRAGQAGLASAPQCRLLRRYGMQAKEDESACRRQHRSAIVEIPSPCIAASTRRHFVCHVSAGRQRHGTAPAAPPYSGTAHVGQQRLHEGAEVENPLQNRS